MTTPQLATTDICTGCGACIMACKRGCIQFTTDLLGVRTPIVDSEGCVGCGQCTAACHLLHADVIHKKSDNVYAAWQIDDVDRASSASGGIASAIYRWALSQGIHCYGVPSDDVDEFCFIELADEADVTRCKNSKYVESDMKSVFGSASKYLRSGDQVLFIGLPCQVAALKTFVGPSLVGNLLTIDIICHGVCPPVYLREHISSIEQSNNRLASRFSFRDPNFGTSKFRFTLSDNRGRFYSKGPKSDDSYQVGYHSALIYRANCYRCRYAQGGRAGDLTIGDFSGYGRLGATCSPEQVSCVIASTPAGMSLLGDLDSFGVKIDRRDPDEAFLFERQLQGPSTRHARRDVFEKAYSRNVGFDASVQAAVGSILRRNQLIEFFRLREISAQVRSCIPRGLKRFIKAFLGQ